MKNVNYIERMEEEKEELDLKYAKLDVFIERNKDNLLKEELMLMYHQKRIINEYIKVLDDRILFAKTKEEVSK